MHSNHFVIPEMTRYDGSTAGELDSPCKRLCRMKELLEGKEGEIDLAYLQACYRDHGNSPESTCAHPTKTDTPHTFASMINLSRRRQDGHG